jgi:hypothetical protein
MRGKIARPRRGSHPPLFASYRRLNIGYTIKLVEFFTEAVAQITMNLDGIDPNL